MIYETIVSITLLGGYIMKKESRSDKMYREIAEFLEDKSTEIRHLVLYKSEAEKLKNTCMNGIFQYRLLK